MRARWYPVAEPLIYEEWPTGLFRDATNRKAVWHTTEGNDNVLTWYPVSGGIPHFTILTTGEVKQHYPCDQFSRALVNLRGGVETNTDGAIQIEIVGFAGKEHTAKQLEAITLLAIWLTSEQHVAPLFPMGRLSKPYRRASFAEWDHGVGHFAHGQIPEQDHTDPDMTDATWSALVAGVLGSGTVTPPPPVREPPDTGPRLLERGDRGHAVLQWERNLNMLLELAGYPSRIVVNGEFDGETEAVTRAFQGWHNRRSVDLIDVDGIVGDQSRATMARWLTRLSVQKVQRLGGFQEDGPGEIWRPLL